jgi:predicted nucleic acid-binding protein
MRAGGVIMLPLDVAEEVQFGVEATRDPIQRASRQEALDELLELFQPCSLTPEAALESGRIRGRLRRTGFDLEGVDGHLAGMAMTFGFILVTDDRDFDPLVGEVAIENWLP